MSSLSFISTIRNLAFSLLAAGTLCAGGSLITATQAEAGTRDAGTRDHASITYPVGRTAAHPIIGGKTTKNRGISRFRGVRNNPHPM